jgi:hypothetical protein
VWYPSYSYYPPSIVSIVHPRFCANVLGTSKMSTSLLQKDHPDEERIPDSRPEHWHQHCFIMNTNGDEILYRLCTALPCATPGTPSKATPAVLPRNGYTKAKKPAFSLARAKELLDASVRHSCDHPTVGISIGWFRRDGRLLATGHVGNPTTKDFIKKEVKGKKMTIPFLHSQLDLVRFYDGTSFLDLDARMLGACGAASEPADL